jgi:hypothetical protein
MIARGVRKRHLCIVRMSYWNEWRAVLPRSSGPVVELLEPAQGPPCPPGRRSEHASGWMIRAAD